MVSVEVTVAVASHVVHQENSQRAGVLSNKGACLSEIQQTLHDSALKKCILADKVTALEDQMSEDQQLPCVQSWHLKCSQR